MPEGFNIAKKENHLREGVKPIFVSIGTLEDFKKSREFDKQNFKDTEHGHIYNSFGLTDKRKEKNGLENVDWFAEEEELEANAFLHSGEGTYVMSQISDLNKISEDLHCCTSVIVVGQERNTNKNISFLTHQIPSATGSGKKFLDHLKLQLEGIEDRSNPGTIDAVVLGGDYVKRGLSAKEYKKAIESISKEVKEILHFEPTVINGPKSVNAWEGDTAYLDNDNRRIYLVRPKVNQDIKDFVPSEFDKEEGKL